jgi:hypothetical protein
MKKICFSILPLAVLLLTSTITFAQSDTESFDVMEEGGLHTTHVVIVEDGEIYCPTEKEYLSFLDNENFEGEPLQSSNKTVTENDENFNTLNSMNSSSITPRTSLYYKFKPTERYRYYASNSVRVSAIYDNASQISVTNTVSKTRYNSVSGGISITTGIKKKVDAAVSASYSYESSASSSTSSSITGVFEPSGKYRYSAIVFQPRWARITGTLQFRQSFEGEDTLISSYTQKWIYPVNSGGLFDGVYSLVESNSKSDIPELP